MTCDTVRNSPASLVSMGEALCERNCRVAITFIPSQASAPSAAQTKPLASASILGVSSARPRSHGISQTDCEKGFCDEPRRRVLATEMGRISQVWKLGLNFLFWSWGKEAFQEAFSRLEAFLQFLKLPYGSIWDRTCNRRRGAGTRVGNGSFLPGDETAVQGRGGNHRWLTEAMSLESQLQVPSISLNMLDR